MKHWQSGSFERERISGVLRPFAPVQAAERLEEVDLEDLYDQGKRLILLDVDNTLVEWKQENFSEEVLSWVSRAKELGFNMCIISNTRRVQRLSRIAETLSIATVRGRFKPSRVMYRLALIKFGCKREQAVMIGDQMMTDILGANRAGIDAIWVRQIAPKEFAPTRINRMVERLLTSFIYKALVLPEHRGTRETARGSAPPLVQQIIRFVIVGVVSFAIDAGITFALMKWRGEAFGSLLVGAAPRLFSWASSPDKAAAPFFKGVAALFAMYNSYVWNRIWTFEAKGSSPKSAQIRRFFAVSLMGAGLNALMFTGFYDAMPGKQVFLSTALAAMIAAIWNFIGQRQFAFKPRKVRETPGEEQGSRREHRRGSGDDQDGV